MSQAVLTVGHYPPIRQRGFLNIWCYTGGMVLPKHAMQFIGAVIFVALGALAIHFLAAKTSPGALTKTYSNPAWGFMVKMPADFSAYPPSAAPERDETGAPTGQVIVLQNKSGAAVQIVVTQDSREESSSILTADDIEQIAPYYDLSQAAPIEIAPGVTGVTFTDSKHPAYGSATEEVWFTYRGNLYEVTADAKNGALFKSMMATWTFI